MRGRALCLNLAVVSMLAASPGMQISPTVRNSSAEVQKAASCSAPEDRQFDFWVGDWDVYDFGDRSTVVARTRVDAILDGCVLREDYQGTNGARGQSFSIYDAARKLWHQSWVTNRGQLLLLDGKFRSGQMVLSGVDPAKSPRTLVRGTWKPVRGGVRETAVLSTDNGKTWKPWFDLLFRPHKP